MIREQVQIIPYSLPSGANQLIVNVTVSAQSLYYGEVYIGTADKTAAEINNAYQSGQDVYALVNGQYLPYSGGNAGHSRFYIKQNDNNLLTEITLICINDPAGDIWTFEAVKMHIIGGIEYVENASAATYTAGSGNYKAITVPTIPSGKKIIAISVIAWSTNTGAFSIIPYQDNKAYLIADSGVQVTGLKCRFWYI